MEFRQAFGISVQNITCRARPIHYVGLHFQLYFFNTSNYVSRCHYIVANFQMSYSWKCLEQKKRLNKNKVIFVFILCLKFNMFSSGNCNQIKNVVFKWICTRLNKMPAISVLALFKVGLKLSYHRPSSDLFLSTQSVDREASYYYYYYYSTVTHGGCDITEPLPVGLVNVKRHRNSSVSSVVKKNSTKIRRSM